jgi:methylmalonyl-CoA decarboxylase
MSQLHTQLDQHIATITLCRRSKKNAFDDQLLEDAIAAFNNISRDKVRVVVLRAEPGVKVWSAGRDVDCLPRSGDPIAGWNRLLTALGEAIRHCPVPVIAMVEGSVWGYGCEVVFSCDLIVAERNASFAITPTKLGVAYDLHGMNTFMQRLGSSLARQLLFTAESIPAQRLYDLGIINYLVAADQLEQHLASMSAHISQLAPLTLAAIKQQIRDLSDNPAVTQQAIAANSLRDEQLFSSADYLEGIAAMTEKRKPVFKGE